MSKFIKIPTTSRVERFDREIKDYVTDFVKESIYINVDRIESIYPMGDTCMINLIGEDNRISCGLSAEEVYNQINN